MKLFRLEKLEDYKQFTVEICARDQPIFLYQSADNPALVLTDSVEVDNPEDEITRLLDLQAADDIITDEDEVLFDFSDDDEMGLLLI